jgi:hypothetical protein
VVALRDVLHASRMLQHADDAMHVILACVTCAMDQAACMQRLRHLSTGHTRNYKNTLFMRALMSGSQRTY